MTKQIKKAGRPKGALDLRSRNLRQAIQKSGMTPLEFMLNIMCDENEEPARRLDAAKHAAPYCHAKRQSVVVEQRPYEGDPNTVSAEELDRLIYRRLNQDAPVQVKGKAKPGRVRKVH